MWIFRCYNHCKINITVNRRDYQVLWVNQLRKLDSQDSTRQLIQAMMQMTGTATQYKSFKLSIVPATSRGISTPLKKGFG